MASRIDPNYGKRCLPTFGPGSCTKPYARRVGVKNVSARRLSTGKDNTDSGKTAEGDTYGHWCDFWGTKKTHLGVPDVEPDLSPSKQLPSTMMVNNDEREMRHALDEDLRWFKNHNNKKPEKVEIREEARRSKSVLELSRIAQGGIDSTLKRNFNRFGAGTSLGGEGVRPKRLETWGSPMKVWTPRRRPKTPAPLDVKNRLGQVCTIGMPSKADRDPLNPATSKDLQHQAFGFLAPPSKSTFLVKEAPASAEYDRFSNFKNDWRTHWRKSANPQDGYGEPATTSMELGWHATNPSTYEPICGHSPALHDVQAGLPRISLAGGTPGRLNSEMSRFVDNVLSTRPGFNPF